MLDKSIPYYHVLMKRPAQSPDWTYPLAEGFTFSWYRPGDEQQWAAIETAVDEFPHPTAALQYYEKEFLPFADELPKRQLFVRHTESGEWVGTTSCWFAQSGAQREPIIHWVAVKPQYQGYGLGKALLAESLRRQRELDGDTDVYLHTQTWSHRAIHMYLKAGFVVLRDETFAGNKNEYEQAAPYLRRLVPAFEG